MRKRKGLECSMVCLSVILAFSSLARAQTTFHDDFEDGDFTNNPTWTGQTSFYMVETDPLDSANLVLRGSGTTSGHRGVSSHLTDEVPWDRFIVSFDLLSTVETSGAHGTIYVRFGDSTSVGSFTYSQRIGTGLFWPIIARGTNFTAGSEVLAGAAQAPHIWYRVALWHKAGDTDRIVIRFGRIGGTAIAQLESERTGPRGVASGISWIELDTEETFPYYYDNIRIATVEDCNGNTVPDEFDILDNGSVDCNNNGIPDECEADCNANGVPDECDIADETSNDFNDNGIPDSCEPDCQPNDIPDFLDIALGLSDDCNLNEIPDECESDCQPNGIPDDCDIADGTSDDCNGNDAPDECDIADETSPDVNGNSVPDECDLGSCCHANGNCAATIEAACLVGAWTLDGGCEPNICPQPGACCLEDTSCAVSLEAKCPSDIWTEGEVCTLANCPSADCNENGIRDDQDIASATSDDCNINGVPDECDTAGAGGATVFASGIGAPEEILASSGNYPPGFFVTGLRPGAVYHVSSLGGTVTTFASGFGWPIGATMTPDEFGGSGARLFVADVGVGVFSVAPSGTVTPFANLGVSETARGLVYIPQSLGGIAGGRLLATSPSDSVGFDRGSLFVIDADGLITPLIESVGANLWTPTLAPDDFGDHANRVFVGETLGPHLYTFDLTTLTLGLFANVPLPEGSPGLRQIAFSPVGWAESFNPKLANERVLIVSVSSVSILPSVGGSVVSVWDQRGTHIATLSTGPDGLPFEPRGLLFVKNDLLVSDLASDHDWLFRVTIEDFGLSDCDGDGTLDECEIEEGSTDCNENAVPDECEVDCNGNGVADQCDLIDGSATDCNGNFTPDSCEEPDCNDNGFPDSCDLADGISRDLNRNHIPDECDTFVGDFDDDKDTDLDDYAILESCLAVSGPGVTPIFDACLVVFDFDNDGDVDLRDAAVFEAEFTGSGE